MLTLYSYWRSTTSYRVRVALNLKGLPYETVPVDLVAGAQRASDYVTLNPGRGVPTLVLEDGSVLTQSLAILDYLDQIAPDPALLPTDALLRARVQAAAQTIALDIHPVNNLKVVSRLKSEYGLTGDDAIDWMRHWMSEGFRAYQALLPDGPAFSFADTPLLCDICLVAQLYNAHRWGVDMTSFARLLDIEKRALKLPAFDAARPENQPDAA
ncbi:maleylacetoacetate isomerase [Sedimentitalea nanhaiensis]|uniref:Maleylacetoacetate isomerase/maleylpyruvate isomerase n=1 Tax=Sedimentitalea nanhaiensis TaxID=999627 RepID=A0A1I6X4I4_9RHOB|nr:maleylacetoacetate isomerase [Sedimentitalea nanhaiensis]SFT32841.1 maleylacetoacetate isomerase/maleylpyruvate isomerase [Sedimentitalea nanhaiensis]